MSGKYPFIIVVPKENRTMLKKWLKDHSYLWCTSTKSDPPFEFSKKYESEDWQEINDFVNVGRLCS